jgi:hypothetical protein
MMTYWMFRRQGIFSVDICLLVTFSSQSPRSWFIHQVEMAIHQVEMAIHQVEMAIHQVEMAIHQVEVSIHKSRSP